MAEFLLELYSEEIPPQLQVSARNELKELIEKFPESPYTTLAKSKLKTLEIKKMEITTKSKNSKEKVQY